jgi:hypothetical protein
MMERPAKRPANSVLASGREAPIQLPDWKRGLADYLQRRDEPAPEEPRRPRSAGSTVRRQPVLDLHREEPADAEADEEAAPAEEGAAQSPDDPAEERP